MVILQSPLENVAGDNQKGIALNSATTNLLTSQVEPFSEFASYYDSFMLKVVDYVDWIKYIEKIFKTFKVKPKTILDLACGTGIPTLLLAKKGYRMIGIDRSAAMLEVLRKKSKGIDITALEADIRDFKLPEQVDAAICLYDSINYLLTEEDLKKCFRSVRTALAKNGLLIFDVNTDYGLASFWGTRETTREAGNVHSIWRNSYDDKTKISTLNLTCYVKGENRSFEEVHQERGYELPVLQELLKSCGFPEVKFYHHGTFSAPNEITVRVMVVAR